MSELANELKDLRRLCASIITRLDTILPECEDTTAGQQQRPLVVPGRCESITQHAIDRFRERTGTKKGDENCCNRIACRIASGIEMAIKPKYRVHELIDHGGSARYFRSADLLFVVDAGVVVTAHQGTADRWTPLPAAPTPQPASNL